MPIVFISPSNQSENVYATNNTNEKEQCERIGKALEKHLKMHGFDVVMADENARIADRINQANSHGVDVYLCVHTNAYDGTVMGTRGFCFSFTGEGYKIVKEIVDALSPITPGDSPYIREEPSFIEVYGADAPTAYIECEFHDNPISSDWIVNNTDNIAKKICLGLCNYYKIPYTEECKEFTVSGITRSYKDAEKMCNVLVENGFSNVMLTEYTKW